MKYVRNNRRKSKKENFERKMFVDTRINACTCNSFYLLPFQEDCLLFFALFYYSLLFLKFERGVATPVTPPPLDPPMNQNEYTTNAKRFSTEGKIFLRFASSLDLSVQWDRAFKVNLLVYNDSLHRN